MTVIKISSIRRPWRVLMTVLLLIICTLPFQHRMHGVSKAFSRSLIPSDLFLPEFFSKTVYFYLTDPLILLFVVGLLLYARPSWRSFCWQGASKWLSLFCCAALISILVSVTAHYPLQYIRLAHYALGILLFYALVQIRHKVEWTSLIASFAWALFAIGVLEGVLALLQYSLQHSLGLSSLGEMRHTHFCIPVEGTSLYLGGTHLDVTCLYRASGTFSHPNILGALLVCSLLATCYLYIRGRFRLGLSVALALQIGALLVTFSRAGFFCFLLVFALFCWSVRSWKLFWTTAVLLAVGIVILSPPLLSRGGIFNYNTLVQESDAERVLYAKMALQMIKEHPWWGVGFNNFQLYSTALHSKVHNIYLLLAAETGLIGCGLFCLFLYRVVQPAFKRLLHLGVERAFLLAAFGGMLCLGCVDFFFVNVSAASVLFFIFAALLYGTEDRC